MAILFKFNTTKNTYLIQSLGLKAFHDVASKVSTQCPS